MYNRVDVLQVKRYPLPLKPPIMVFTAKFLQSLALTSKSTVVEFYYVIQPVRMHSGTSRNQVSENGSLLAFLGSALIGKNQKAVLKRRMNAGKYTIIARAMIDDCEIWSNEVSVRIS